MDERISASLVFMFNKLAQYRPALALNQTAIKLI
jgi:hypothetical protein